MDRDTFAEDLRTYLRVRDLTVNQLAKEARVEPRSLYGFLKDASIGLSAKTVFALWPLIYGDQRPVLFPHGLKD